MFWLFIVAVVLVRIFLAIVSHVDLTAWNLKFNKKTRYVAGLFMNNFIDSRVLFVTRFRRLPSVGVITQIDVTQAYAFINEKMSDQIIDVHQANMFDHNEGKTYFNMTILELRNNRMIELGNGYVEVMYTNAHYEWAKVLLEDLAAFKVETGVVEEKAPTVIGFARAMEMN
jgi:hypothetical protein